MESLQGWKGCGYPPDDQREGYLSTDVSSDISCHPTNDDVIAECADDSVPGALPS